MALTQVGPAISYAAASLNGIAASGQVFVASNIAIGTPTAGTGVTWVAAQTTFADTQPNFIIQNSDTAKSIHLLAIKMTASAIGTSATSWHYAGVLDTAARAITTSHYASAAVYGANSGALTPQGFALPSVLYQTGTTAGVIAASSANSRLISRGSLGGLNIVGDEFLVKFGSFEGSGTTALTAAEVAGVGTRKSSDGPVVIAPGSSYTFTLWGIASAAAINPDFQIWMAAF